MLGTHLQIALFLLIVGPACIQAVEPQETTDMLKQAFDGARKRLSKLDQDILEERKTKESATAGDEESVTATEMNAQAATGARAKLDADQAKQAAAEATAKAQALDIEANQAVQETAQLKQQADGVRQTKTSHQAAAVVAADKKKEQAEVTLKSMEDAVSQTEAARDQANGIAATANNDLQTANAKASVSNAKSMGAKKASATQSAESAKAAAQQVKQTSDLANFEEKNANKITQDAVDEAKRITAKAENDAVKAREDAKEDATSMADAEKKKAKRTALADKANGAVSSATSAAEAGTVAVKKTVDEAAGKTTKAEVEAQEAFAKTHEARAKVDKAVDRMESNQMDSEVEIESLKTAKRAIDEEAEKFDKSTSEAVDIIQSTAQKTRFRANAKIAQASADKETSDYATSASESAAGSAKAAKQRANTEAAAVSKEADAIVDKTLKTGVDEAETKKSQSSTGSASAVAISSQKAQAEAQAGAADAMKAAAKTQKSDAQKVLKSAKAEDGTKKIVATVGAQEKISKANQDLKKAEADVIAAKRVAQVKRESANEAGDSDAADIAVAGNKDAAASEAAMASDEVAAINDASNANKRSIDNSVKSEVEMMNTKIREERAKINVLREEEVAGNKKIDQLNAEASDTEAAVLKSRTEIKRLATETEQVQKSGKLTAAQSNSKAELEAMGIEDVEMQATTWKTLNPKGKLFLAGTRTKAGVKKNDDSRMSIQRRQSEAKRGVVDSKVEINEEHQADLEHMRNEHKPHAEGLDASKADVEIEVEAEEKKLSKCTQETAKWNNQLARLQQERERLIQAEVHWKLRSQRNKKAASTYMNDLMAKSLGLQKKVEALEMKMAAAALKLNNIGGKLV